MLRLSREMPIGAAIALLKKEIADRQSALFILEGLVAQGIQTAPVAAATANGLNTRGRKGKGKLSLAKAGVEILRAAGRPMHGGRELVPALEAQGYKVKHPNGLATTLMRTGEVKRTDPGTFAYKEGAEAAASGH